MKATVALAEDDPDQRKLLTLIVEHLGYEVICAGSNGEELLNCIANVDADVVIVDLDMPIIDGLEAAEVISERGIPVIMISGQPDAKEMVVEKEPIVVQLLKPATKEAIREALEIALGGGHGLPRAGRPHA